MKQYIATVTNGYHFTNHLSKIEQGDLVYAYDKKGKKEVKWLIEHFNRDGVWKTNQSSNLNDIYLVNEFDNRENDLEELKDYKRQQISVTYFDTLYDSKEQCEKHIEKMSKYSLCVHEGTGKITQLYKVVEVLDLGLFESELKWCGDRSYEIVSYNGIELDIDDKIKGQAYQDILSYKSAFQEKLFNYKNQRFIIKLELIKDIDMELSEFVSWNKLDKDKDYDVINGVLYWSWKPQFEGDYDDMHSVDKNNYLLTRYTKLQRVIRIGGE